MDLALSGHEHSSSGRNPSTGYVRDDGQRRLSPVLAEAVNTFTAAFDNTVYGYTVVEIQGGS